MERHAGHLGGCAALPAPGDEVAAEQMALQPVFARLAALLGQAAGVLMLALVRADPERQRLHLAAMRENHAAAAAALAAPAAPSPLAASRRAAEQALPILRGILDALDARYGAALEGGAELSDLFRRLAAARRILLAGSEPRLGLGLVDLTGACCAGRP
jgi:hypothetical protein